MTLDAMLAAIHEALDDDAPRLVYGDALQQQGDPRGEYIVVQCLLERTPEHDPAWPALVRREHALWIANYETWRAPRRWFFRRGFPTHVFAEPRDVAARLAGCPTATVLSIYAMRHDASFDEATDLGRVTSLSVQSRASPVRWLASGVADRIRSLALYLANENDLHDLPQLPSLRSLTTSGHRGWTVTRVPRVMLDLETLSLSHLELPVTELARQAAAFSRLQRLSLWRCSTAMAHTLVAAATPGTLTDLHLYGHRGLGDDFVELPALRGVRRLVLAGTRIGDAVLAKLLPRLEAVEHLDLSNCALGPAGARALARWPHLTRLRTLDLSHNPIGVGVRAFSEVVPRLDRLELDRTDVGDDVASLAGWIPSLRTLGLERCGIGARGLRAIASQLGPDLLALDLRRNPLGIDGIAAIVEAAPASFDPLILRVSHQHKVSHRALHARFPASRRRVEVDRV